MYHFNIKKLAQKTKYKITVYKMYNFTNNILCTQTLKHYFLKLNYKFLQISTNNIPKLRFYCRLFYCVACIIIFYLNVQKHLNTTHTHSYTQLIHLILTLTTKFKITVCKTFNFTNITFCNKTQKKQVFEKNHESKGICEPPRLFNRPL